MDDLQPCGPVFERARAAQVGQFGRSDRARGVAHRAIARVFRPPQFDHLRARFRKRRIERREREIGFFGQGSGPAQLEHQQAADVAHRVHVVDQRAIGGQREGPAPAGQHGDILFAVHGVGDRRGDHAGLRGETPQPLAIGRIVGGKLAARIALENQPAAGRQQAAVPRPGMLDAPAGFLRHRVPRDQLALDRALHLAADAQIGRQIARAQIEADVEPARAVGLPVCLGCIEHRGLEGWDVH